MNSISVNFDSKIPYIFQAHPIKASLITLFVVGCIALFVTALMSRLSFITGLNATAAFAVSIPGFMVAFHLLRKQTIVHLHALVRNPLTTPQQFEAALSNHSQDLWTSVNGNSCLDVVVENERRDLLPILLKNEVIKHFFTCHGIISALEKERPDLALKYLRCGSSLKKNFYVNANSEDHLRILRTIFDWKEHFTQEDKRVLFSEVFSFLQGAKKSNGQLYLTPELLERIVEESLSSFTISLRTTGELVMLLLQWRLFECAVRKDRFEQAILECLGITIDPLQAYDVYIYRQLDKQKRARVTNKMTESENNMAATFTQLLARGLFEDIAYLPRPPEEGSFLEFFDQKIQAMEEQEQLACEDLLRSFHNAALKELSSVAFHYIPVAAVVEANIGGFLGLARTEPLASTLSFKVIKSFQLASQMLLDAE